MNRGQHIHFIGIGGIGISALAKYFLYRGDRVSGSDLKRTEITDDLAGFGVKIAIGPHKKTSIPKGADRVIYTAAVPKNSPELFEARRRKIRTETYAVALGELTRTYRTIAVSGSHGKSTTTSMIAFILEEGYCDPMVIVGTKLKEFGNSNFRPGMGNCFVLEADEWNRSFLNYSPYIAVVTNIDAEHLDTYKNADEVESAFREYLERVPRDGAVIANYDDARVRRVAAKFGRRVFWYSLRDKEALHVRRVLRVPGEHNVSNALAALRTGRALGIRESDILHGLSRYTGAWRRFEFKGFVNGASIFDDYGHHPKEISATIQAARSRFPFRRVWCVYQPHQYQRLLHLWDGFLTAFDMADTVCLLPVYDVAGREKKAVNAKVSSEKLARALFARGKSAHYFPTQRAAETYIRAYARRGDVVLIMGAGDINTLTPKILASKNSGVSGPDPIAGISGYRTRALAPRSNTLDNGKHVRRRKGWKPRRRGRTRRTK